jgi:single-stranded DNA-specific DHH superfamily exonuclease
MQNTPKAHPEPLNTLYKFCTAVDGASALLNASCSYTSDPKHKRLAELLAMTKAELADAEKLLERFGKMVRESGLTYDQSRIEQVEPALYNLVTMSEIVETLDFEKLDLAGVQNTYTQLFETLDGRVTDLGMEVNRAHKQKAA